MNEVMSWAIIAGTLFISFVVLMLRSIVKKHLNLFITSLVVLFLSIGAGGVAVYKFARQALHKVNVSAINNETPETTAGAGITFEHENNKPISNK